ncbi:hypothetical protein LTR27_000305 [Elasticomyces elasticus]|nr:hypothetical protein LTR27_000305 [Elasticomyces elasticus]
MSRSFPSFSKISTVLTRSFSGGVLARLLTSSKSSRPLNQAVTECTLHPNALAFNQPPQRQRSVLRCTLSPRPLWIVQRADDNPRHIRELWGAWLTHINDFLTDALWKTAVEHLRARRKVRSQLLQQAAQAAQAAHGGRSQTFGRDDAPTSQGQQNSLASFNRVFTPPGMTGNNERAGGQAPRTETFADRVPGLFSGEGCQRPSRDGPLSTWVSTGPSGVRAPPPGANAPAGAELRRMQRIQEVVLPVRASPSQQTSIGFPASMPSTQATITFGDSSPLSYPCGGRPRGSSLGSQDVSFIEHPPGYTQTQTPRGDVTERSQLLQERLGSMKRGYGLEPSTSPSQSQPLESPRVVSLRGTPRDLSAQHTSPTANMPTRTHGRTTSQPSAASRFDPETEDSSGSPARGKGTEDETKNVR